MAYSKDFRDLALSKHKQGVPKRKICRDLNISRPTLSKWIMTGGAKLGKPGRKEPDTHTRSELEQHVENFPDMKLKERGEAFNLSISGMSKALSRLKIYKKKLSL